ncbi:MAG: alpha/beta hydrolase-fold protein [Saprospiraceae bacterium]
MIRINHVAAVNWIPLHKIAIGIILPIYLSGCLSGQEDAAGISRDQDRELSIGKTFSITSQLLGEERPIIVSLPTDYDSTQADYPVMYLTDGRQNIWHVMGTIEVLTRTGSIPPLIVIGIESTNRMRDFTMTKGANQPGSGGGHQFLAFMEQELIPYVDSAYRTHPFRLLEGHSLGGLFAASIFIENPDLFDGYIVMSPALWWNNEDLTKQVAPFLKAHTHLDKALFFGIGTGESSPDFGMRKELKNFVDALAAGQASGLRYERKEMEDEGHMSSALLSNYYGLKFIFADMAFPDSLFENYSDELFLSHERQIMEKYGSLAKQSAESYVRLAFQLREKNKFAGACTVLQRSVEAYPFDVGLMNLLADTYGLNGEINQAILVYQQAIATSKKYHYLREEEFEKQIDRLKNK